jgi:hypothetical protein
MFQDSFKKKQPDMGCITIGIVYNIYGIWYSMVFEMGDNPIASMCFSANSVSTLRGSSGKSRGA